MKLTDILLVAAIGASSSGAMAEEPEQNDALAQAPVSVALYKNWAGEVSCDDNNRLSISYHQVDKQGTKKDEGFSVQSTVSVVADEQKRLTRLSCQPQ